MPNPNKDIPDKQPLSKNIMGKADNSEVEIDLIDYLRVLWKWKNFIFLLTVLPTLIFFFIFNFLPKNYEITYIYDTSIDKEPLNVLSAEFKSLKDFHRQKAETEDELLEKNRRILLNIFYSKENLGKLIDRLRDNGFDIYAQGMSKSKIRLEITNTLSTLTVIGNPEQDLQKISSIVRNNFEKVIPTYTIRDELNNVIAGLKAGMADIKRNNFSMELELERKRAILKKMKNLQLSDPNKMSSGIILQIDNISQNSEYLPLAYQIQVIDANIINIEETINTKQKKYNYYKNLISLNEKLFDEIKSKTSSYYTIQEFHSFMANMSDDYAEEELKDYLNAYTKRIENIISINTPVVEKPSAYPIPRGIVKKSTVLLALLLIITSLGAFLFEAIKGKQAPAP